MQKQLFIAVHQNRYLKNITNFTGKHLCWSLFLIKVSGLRPATLLKRRLQHMFFPVNFAKFLRTHFFYRRPLVSSFVNGKIFKQEHHKDPFWSRSLISDSL